MILLDVKKVTVAESVTVEEVLTRDSGRNVGAHNLSGVVAHFRWTREEDMI
jgi:hypothetical protein